MDNQNDNLNQQTTEQQPTNPQELNQQPTNSQELNQQTITPPTQQEPTTEVNNNKGGKMILLILVLVAIIGGGAYYFLAIKPKEETKQKNEETTTETETTESDLTTNSNDQETSNNTNSNTTGSKIVPVIDFEFAESFNWNDAYDTVKVNNHSITLGKSTLKDISSNFKWINNSLKEKAEVAKEYSNEKNPPKSINDKTKEIVYIKDINILESSNTSVSIWDDSDKEKTIGNIPIYKISHINGQEKVAFNGFISNTDTQKDVFAKLGNPTYASVVDNVDPTLVCEWETSDYVNQKIIRVIFNGNKEIYAIEIEHKI